MSDDNIHPLFRRTAHDADSIPFRAIRELDQVADAARVTIGGALALNRLARSPLDNVSQAARTAQATVVRMMMFTRSDRDDTASRDDRIPTPLFRWGRRLDDRLDALRQAGARGDRLTRALTPVWTWVGLLITSVAAVSVISHQWFLAAGLLALRVVISRRLGSEANLPYEGHTHDRRSTVLMYQCIAAHLCDCTVLLAVIWSLLDAGLTDWAFVGTIAAMTMLLGTLSRIAAIQVGVQIIRLTLERVLRVGTTLVALLLTGILQPDLAVTAFPYLALAVIGSLLYGLAELIRTTLRVRHAGTIYGQTPDVSITISGNEAVTEIAQPGARTGAEPADKAAAG